MKSASHPFHKRSPLGLYYEKVLQPALERCVGESLTKTSDCMDQMDFEGASCFVEVKSRGDQYHYSQWFIKKDGWMLPSGKIERAQREVAAGKRVFFFYFWRADKSLWMWEYTEGGVLGCREEYPEWHHDQQKQTFIPEQYWKRVFIS